MTRNENMQALRAAVRGKRDPLSQAIQQVLDELAEAKAINLALRAEYDALKKAKAVPPGLRPGAPFTNHRSTRPQCAHVAVDKSGTKRRCSFRAVSPDGALCRLHGKREAA